jgi:hypothetical protein
MHYYYNTATNKSQLEPLLKKKDGYLIIKDNREKNGTTRYKLIISAWKKSGLKLVHFTTVIINQIMEGSI